MTHLLQFRFSSRLHRITYAQDSQPPAETPPALLDSYTVDALIFSFFSRAENLCFPFARDERTFSHYAKEKSTLWQSAFGWIISQQVELSAAHIARSAGCARHWANEHTEHTSFEQSSSHSTQKLSSTEALENPLHAFNPPDESEKIAKNFFSLPKSGFPWKSRRRLIGFEHNQINKVFLRSFTASCTSPKSLSHRQCTSFASFHGSNWISS